jgi:pimeloyl-ACP methyl ester carboxylesterase
MFAARQQAERSAPDSLSTLLPTPALRRDLAVQLLLLTDSLKQDILSLFTPPPDPSTAGAAAGTPIQDLISLDAAPSPATPPGEDVASPYYVERARRRRANRAAELADARALGLKRAALTHFEAWRARLLRRACEALGTNAEAVKNGRREHVARGMREAEEQERRALLDWAVGGEAAAPGRDDGLERVANLAGLDAAKRAAVLECCLLLVLSLEAYSAHSRVLLMRLTQALNLEPGSLVEMENQTAKTLVQSANANVNADAITKEQAASNASARRWKVGLATVAGAALIGVTGGLAAPLLAAGIGTVTGALGLGAVSGLLGAVAGSSVLIGSIFGAFGGRMTGKVVEQLAKDIEDFKFIPLKDGHVVDQTPNQPSLSAARPVEDTTNKLRVAIGIHGPLTSNRDILHPAYLLSSAGASTFALRWEVAALTRLGLSLTTLLRSYVWDVAKYEILRRTLLGALAAGLWPLGLLRAARVVDNPFAVARARADKAGIVLARALIARCAGDRPVVLVGWSLGARVIWACLQELARQNAFGVVESAVLVGAPVPGDSAAWTRARAVVVGRLVNAYSTNDVLLGLVYRANSGQVNVAGLQAVEDVHGVENFDASALLDGDGHTKYRVITGQILATLSFEDLDEHGLMREKRAKEALAAQEKQKPAKKEVDPEKEAAVLEKKVNAAVRERVGRGAMVDMLVMDVDDEKELRKKFELLKVAEDRTPQTQAVAKKPEVKSAIDVEPKPQMPISKGKFSPLFVDMNQAVDDPLSQAVDDPLGETVVDPVLLAAVESERTISKTQPTVKVTQTFPEVASDDDDELTYLDPEPLPDSDDEY